MLVDGSRDANKFELEWDGRNARGERVASGVYFYRLVTGDTELTKKMMFLR